MKKRINLKEYYMRLDDGQGAYLLQNNEKYDLKGFSLTDYPDEVQEETITELILPKSQKPYNTYKHAEDMAGRMKKLKSFKIVNYKEGFAIEGTL